MTVPGAMWVLAGFVISGRDIFLCVTGDCLWYLDNNGSRHEGFECPLSSFCCGDCHSRYCCSDPLRFISEGQQKRCLPAISPRMKAGISSFLSILILLLLILACCSCCYLYRRRSQMVEYDTQEVQMVVIPVQTYPHTHQPMYAAPHPGYGYPPPGTSYPPPGTYAQPAPQQPPPPYDPPKKDPPKKDPPKKK